MKHKGAAQSLNFLIWVIIAAAIAVPIAAAVTSPLLAWRGPIYIMAGFAGVIAFSLLLIQPLLAGGYLPGLSPIRRRSLHLWVGSSLLVLVIIHVATLWITSPPDLIDALLFASPTPFSNWGVVAMWALFTTAFLGAFRRTLRLRPKIWRLIHTVLAAVIVIGSIVHAWLVQGTMETTSKAVLCALIFIAFFGVVVGMKSWTKTNALRCLI